MNTFAERARRPAVAVAAFAASFLLLVAVADGVSGATAGPVSSLIINQDGQVVTSISTPDVGTQLRTGLDYRPASRVQATLELAPGAEERLLILTQMERPIFTLQSPDGKVIGQELQNSFVVQGNGAPGSAVLTISGSLPVDQGEFSLVQLVSENGHGLLEAINIRGTFETSSGGLEMTMIVAIVEGVLLALVGVAAVLSLRSGRRVPAGRF